MNIKKEKNNKDALKKVNPLTEIPGLQKYYKYMLEHRNVSVKFTVDEINEIIEKDICIDIEENTLCKKISVEAFAYFLYNWPGWKNSFDVGYSDQNYNELVEYLQSKFTALKISSAKETTITHEIPISDDVLKAIIEKDPTKTVNISLEISAPEELFKTTKLKFTTDDVAELQIQFDKLSNTTVDFKMQDIINHPFVIMDFNVPGLFHIRRENRFKVVECIHHSTTKPQLLESDFIISMEKGTNAPKSKVYTHRILLAFFNNLNDVLQTDYSIYLSKSRLEEISTICEHFMQDVLESNICESTVCENYIIDFNMGGKYYCVDTIVDKEETLIKSDVQVLHKKVLTPIISYSLVCCNLLQDDIANDGTESFPFLKKMNKSSNSPFLQYIKDSITYSCVICKSTFNLETLKEHLNNFHPLDPEVYCDKCLNTFSTSQLLLQRWSHNCTPILTSF